MMLFPSYWLIGGCLLLAPLAAVVETYRQEGPAQTPRSAFQRALDRAADGGTLGVQAVVIIGDVEWQGTAGLASRERGTRMTLDHRLRTASITKMMTYAVIAELAKQRRLDVADFAISRLPANTLAGIPHADSITIEQLLEHTSGLHNFNGPNGADFFRDLNTSGRPRIRSAAELIAYARKPSNPPTGKPGAARSYSSTGYIVLELIAEHVTATPLPQLYRQIIFQPLQMKRSGMEGYDLSASAIGASYERRAAALVNLSAGMQHFGSWARGAGAVASTACDLATFMRAVTTNRLVVLRNQAQEFAAAKSRPRASFNWNGGSPGIQASIFYQPSGDITVIVLTNATGVATESISLGRELLEIARSDSASLPRNPCP